VDLLIPTPTPYKAIHSYLLPALAWFFTPIRTITLFSKDAWPKRAATFASACSGMYGVFRLFRFSTAAIGRLISQFFPREDLRRFFRTGTLTYQPDGVVATFLVLYRRPCLLPVLVKACRP